MRGAVAVGEGAVVRRGLEDGEPALRLRADDLEVQLATVVRGYSDDVPDGLVLGLGQAFDLRVVGGLRAGGRGHREQRGGDGGDQE